jgi:hypothetical protein
MIAPLSAYIDAGSEREMAVETLPIKATVSNNINI